MKKIIYLLFIMILFIANIGLVKANTLDTTKKGTITITLKESGKENPIVGAEISIYKIASATSENHNLKYVYTNELSSCQSNLNDLTNTSLAKELSECIKEVNIANKKETNQNGIVKFTDLDLGLYLVSETNNVDGYSNIDNFLVQLPVYVDNSWDYSVEALPKTDIIRVMNLTVEKVWNITKSKKEEYVTIELYNGEELFDTITLNDENNWTHTWQRIPESDAYTVVEKDVPKNFVVTYKQIEDKFIVTNTDKLPQTGLTLWQVELFSFLGIIFIIIGFILEKGNNHEQNR